MGKTVSENKMYSLFVSCPKGVERSLFKELSQLGVSELRETVGGVHGEAPWLLVYSICLYSRVANRVFLVLNQQNINSEKDLYQAASAVPWSAFFSENKRFVVDFTGTNKAIRHSQFGALRIKDAIVDCFVRKLDQRPDVARQQPDIRINVYLNKLR